MARITAPTSGPLIKTHPLTGHPIYPLGFRRDGRAIWPIMGGDETAGTEGSGAGPDAGSGSGDGQGATGFPANTPLEQMNAEQREAYWKHQAQNWQGRAKGNFAQLQQLGIKSADDLAEIQRKIEQHDALEQELMSDKDKAIAQAKKEAEATVSSTYLPQLVGAKLDAAAARKGISEDSLTAALSFVDHAKFLNESGEIDAAKVSAFIDGIAPAKGTQPQPRGPVIFGGGIRPNSSPEPGSQGKAMAEKRFGKKQ